MQRIEFIDIAKGISIVMVALHHSPLRGEIPEVVDPMSLFRMPLFFFLSGLFFRHAREPARTLLARFDAWMKPYYVTLILVCAVSSILLGEDFLRHLRDILYGTGPVIPIVPMWFLPHLFLVYAGAYGLIRLTPFRELPGVFQWLLLSLSLLLGSYSIAWFWNYELTLWGHLYRLPGLPFSLDLLPISLAYFMAGHLLASRVIDFRPSGGMVVLSAAVYLWVVLFTGAHIDLNRRIHEGSMAAIVGSVAGIYLVLAFSYGCARFEVAKRSLVRLGKSSLFILIFHYPVGDALFRWMTSAISGREGEPGAAALAFLLSLVVPLGIHYLIERNRLLALLYLPVAHRGRRKLSSLDAPGREG